MLAPAEFSELNHTNHWLMTRVSSAQKVLRLDEMLPLRLLPVVALMLSWRQFHWASSENNFLLLLSLFGNFLAPNQHNCAEVGGVPRLRLRSRASAGVVHSFRRSFLHRILLMFLLMLRLQFSWPQLTGKHFLSTSSIEAESVRSGVLSRRCNQRSQPETEELSVKISK